MTVAGCKVAERWLLSGGTLPAYEESAALKRDCPTFSQKLQGDASIGMRSSKWRRNYPPSQKGEVQLASFTIRVVLRLPH